MPPSLLVKAKNYHMMMIIIQCEVILGAPLTPLRICDALDVKYSFRDIYFFVPLVNFTRMIPSSAAFNYNAVHRNYQRQDGSVCLRLMVCQMTNRFQIEIDILKRR